MILDSFVAPIYCCNNSMPVQVRNFDLAVQSELFVVEMPTQNIRSYTCYDSDNSSLQQMSVRVSRTYDRRG